MPHTFRYDFNAKEHQPELGLNWHDYHARNYDAALGRWMNVDPLGENAPDRTPYHFVSNNPINRIDPNGLTDYKVNKKTGEVNRVGNPNDDPDRILRTNSKGEIKIKGEGFLGFLVSKSEKGKPKVAVDGIAKGFLEDGGNLKTKRISVDINGSKQPTLSESKNSVVKISEYLGKELAADLWSNNESSISIFTVEPFGDNEINMARPLSPKIKVISYKGIDYTRRKSYHTHPYGNIYTDPLGSKGLLNPSTEDRNFAESLNLPSIILSIKGQNHYNKNK